MRVDLKEKLDKAEKIARIKSYVPASLVILFFLGLMAIFVPNYPINNAQIEGRVYKLSAKPMNEGNVPIMLVEIENGEIVKASMPMTMEYRRGAKVELSKTDTLIGVSTFQVIRYIE